MAVSLFQDALRYLGAGIVNIIYLYNPSIIVFGDEMVTYGAGHILLDTVQKYVKERVSNQLYQRITMKLSTVNADPAFWGAGVLVLDNISDILFDQNMFL